MTVLKRKLEKSPKKHTHKPIKAISAEAFKNMRKKKKAITVLQNVFKLLPVWLTALGFFCTGLYTCTLYINFFFPVMVHIK